MNELEFLSLARMIIGQVAWYGPTVAKLSAKELNELVEAEPDNTFDFGTRLVLKVLAENELARR